MTQIGDGGLTMLLQRLLLASAFLLLLEASSCNQPVSMVRNDFLEGFTHASLWCTANPGQSGASWDSSGSSEEFKRGFYAGVELCQKKQADGHRGGGGGGGGGSM